MNNPHFKTGLVIGKFYPPHRGHHYLIDTALTACAKLHVLVCHKPSQSIPGRLRAQWIRQRHPEAVVHEVDDTLGDDDTQGWAHFTVDYLGFVPEVVFSSEEYGPRYAKAMGSQHVSVDPQRQTVPCSGTMIRAATVENRHFLETDARAWFTRRICLVGAESTGKTTLARRLAERLACDWMPEYGREYCLQKYGPSPMLGQQGDEGGLDNWESAEFIHIAREHARREDAMAAASNGVLVVDTDAFATSIWHERYLGMLDAELEDIADERKDLYDLYIVCDIDIPFEQDGTRDGKAIRNWMHDTFIMRLKSTGRPWVLVNGSVDERLEQCLTAMAQYQIELPCSLAIPMAHRIGEPK